jgi:uroporphyrinogen decarboxylase
MKMFRKIRDSGVHVWMHLCGNIRDILPDLVEIGLNVLNPIQPKAMDIKEIAGTFGGKVYFDGGVDVQGTLVEGTPAEVKQEVYMLVDRLGRFNGGYIGKTSHTIMPETPLDNVIAMYEAFLEIQGR